MRLSSIRHYFKIKDWKPFWCYVELTNNYKDREELKRLIQEIKNIGMTEFPEMKIVKIRHND